MKTEHIIDKKGQIISTVLDRQGENCNTSVKLMEGVGAILSDERTGPDCDEIQETTTAG